MLAGSFKERKTSALYLQTTLEGVKRLSAKSTALVVQEIQTNFIQTIRIFDKAVAPCLPKSLINSPVITIH